MSPPLFGERRPYRQAVYLLLFGPLSARRALSPRAALIRQVGAALKGIQACAVQGELCWKLHYDVALKLGVGTLEELYDDPDCVAQRALIEELLLQVSELLQSPNLLLDPLYSEVRLRLVSARRCCGRENCEVLERQPGSAPVACTVAMRFADVVPRSSSGSLPQGGMSEL